MTTFGDKIRKLRKEKKMTQQKLGDMELNDDTDYDDLFEDDWADEIEEYCEKSQK